MMDIVPLSKIKSQCCTLLEKRVFWQALLLAGSAFCIYLRVFHGLFIWDDDDYVTKNLALRSLAGLGDIWLHPGSLSQYYPLTYTSFWIDFHLWGFDPAGYHLVNMILHAVNSLLAWRLLDQLKVKHAWLIAFLFALHPVHVESVAWITERKNLLSGCFCLLSLLAYLRARYFFSYLLFLGALGSKTVTATLPAIIFLIQWWRNGKVSREDLVRIAFFAITALLIGSISISLENQHVVRMGTHDWDFSLADRFLIAGRAIWFYLSKILWPHPLIFFYPRWAIDPQELWQWLYPALFVFTVAFLWCSRKRLGRGPFTLLMIYAVTLFPALGFKNYYPMRYFFVADHFQYLASIAPLVLFVALGAGLLKDKRIQKGAGFLALLCFALLTWDRQAAFASLEDLWRDTIRKNPAAWMAHNNYGALLLDQGNLETAEPHFKEALRLKADNAESFNNLGLLLQKKGDFEKAIPYYQKAIHLQPGVAVFHLNLGTAFLSLGKFEEADASYREALQLNPKLGEAYFSRGNISLQRKDIHEAESLFREAIRFSPDFADSYTSLGFVCSQLGKKDEAIRSYRMAIKLDPKQAFAHGNLANIFSAQNSFEEANSHYRAAIELEPAFAQFRLNFSDSLNRQGKREEAEKYYQEAMQLSSAGTPDKESRQLLSGNDLHQDSSGS